MKLLITLSLCALFVLGPLPKVVADDGYLNTLVPSRNLYRPVPIPDLAIPIRPTSDLGGMSLDDLKTLGLVKEVKTQRVVRRSHAVQKKRRVAQPPVRLGRLGARFFDSAIRETKREAQWRLFNIQLNNEAFAKAPEWRYTDAMIPRPVPHPASPLPAGVGEVIERINEEREAEPLETSFAPIENQSLRALRAASMFASTWYVRNDGSDGSCNGLTNHALAGASGNNCAFATPPVAITATACGDTIQALAGDTFDTTGITLPNKSCSVSTPITITSTATLPNRRVGPSDASLMPRFRTTSTGGNGVFITAVNAGWWVLDGLELTDNAGTNSINALVDFAVTNAGAHDITLTRSWLHQKETGTNYERSVMRAVWFEGQRLTLTKNYLDTIGSPYGTTEPHNTVGLLCVTCQTVTMTDNYVNFWWNGFFTGGGDTAPQHTATLTSASLSSATFSSVTSLTVGTIVRFSVVGTATLSNAGSTPTLLQVSGDPWVAADGNQNGNYGDSALITSVADPTKSGVTRLMTLTTPSTKQFTTTAATSAIATVPNGTVDYVIYQTAKVTNIVGNVVTYDPLATFHGIDYSTNSLQHPPAAAAWNVGDEGVVTDFDVESNTFNVDLAYAIYVQGLGRGCPKGGFELKSLKRLTYKFNQITGYPSVLAMTAANQNGTAPWTTIDAVTMDSNWIHPDTGYPPCSRQAFLIADDAYLNTITPTDSVTITNNLVTGGVRELADIKNGNVWTITHNTAINAQSSDVGPNALLSAQATGIPALNFSDNIGGVVCYGIKDYPGFYVTPTISKNVFVDADSGCSGGITVNTFGTGSGLPPIPTAYSQVGFTNQAANNYLLTGASNFKGQGTGGLDPGVAWNTPSAPWLTTSAGATTMSGKVTLSGKVTSH